MAKRPSVPSTRARQHQVIRYISSTSMSEASKHYNVSPEQLRRFIETPPKSLKGRLNRSTAYKRLYETNVKELAKEHKVKLPPKYSGKELHRVLSKPYESTTVKQRTAAAYTKATRIKRKETTPSGRITYRPVDPTAALARLEHGYTQFNTLESVETGYKSGILSSNDVNVIVEIWKEKYGKTRIDLNRWSSDLING